MEVARISRSDTALSRNASALLVAQHGVRCGRVERRDFGSCLVQQLARPRHISLASRQVPKNGLGEKRARPELGQLCRILTPRCAISEHRLQMAQPFLSHGIVRMTFEHAVKCAVSLGEPVLIEEHPGLVDEWENFERR